MFHSGVYSWLGLYFWQRYHLGDEGIGLALLGYGVPGMLFGPLFGHLADRVGRKRIIPLGILIGALAGAAFIPRAPLLWPVAMTTVLSLGYDMSHPLLAGISTSLNPSRRGLAMGLNSFSLFSGYGLGALAFEPLLKYGFSTALAVFAACSTMPCNVGNSAVWGRRFFRRRSFKAGWFEITCHLPQCPLLRLAITVGEHSGWASTSNADVKRSRASLSQNRLLAGNSQTCPGSSCNQCLGVSF